MKIYFIERRMNKARSDHLKKIANNSSFFTVCSNINHAVTIIAQESTAEQVSEYLSKKQIDLSDSLFDSKTLVDISWFVRCMKEKKIVAISSHDKLNLECSNISTACQNPMPNIEVPPCKKTRTVAKYACQAAVLLNHMNKKYCDALELLEQHALFRGDANCETRALAFRRGSVSLKSSTKEITSENELKNIPYIGSINSAKEGHCKKVVTEILTEGFSDEVESVINSEFYQSMKIFCGIFGVGPSTARKWFYGLNLRNLDDVKKSSLNLSHEQKLGLEHYNDLNTPVSLEEAEVISKFVQEACTKVDSMLTVKLVGGFRRGKAHGHDVDLLITHPENGKEIGVLPLIIGQLKEKFISSDRKMSSQSSTKNVTKIHSTSTMDNFDKCFAIFKLFYSSLAVFPKHVKKDWKAIRVDLIVVPNKQFAFALLGWTGTKHFEREIRRYSKNEKQIVLTSHGMYSLITKQSFSALTEEEIFEKLDLEFRPPSERCC